MKSTVKLILLAFFLSLSCLFLSSAPASATSRAYNPTIEKSYSVDAFDEAYSAGYLAMTADGYSIGSSLTESSSQINGTNTSRDENAYIDIYGGAIIDGVKYDVREYLWLGSSGSSYQRKIGSSSDETAYYIYVSGAAEVYREYHFYIAGTLDSDNPSEINFSGIMHFSDLDPNEGTKIVQGYHGAWVMSATQLAYSEQSDGKQWLGTENTTDSVAASQLWVEIDSTPTTPAIITYKTSSRRHSNIGFSSINLLYTTNFPDGTTEQFTKEIAKYGTYTISDPEWPNENPENYTFSGWYSDQSYTNEQEYTITLVSNDLQLYGYWSKTATSIEVNAVENGSLTYETNDDNVVTTDNNDSTTYSGIESGKTVTFFYTPDDGYELESVVIDGEEINIAAYPSSYTFLISDTLENHTVSVSFKEKPVEPEPEPEEETSDDKESNNLPVPEVPNTGSLSNSSKNLIETNLVGILFFCLALITFSLKRILKPRF